MRKAKRQRIFDRVVEHLAQQGKPAMTKGTCMYRTEDGLSCAVGCLIPNDKYEPAMENQRVGAVLNAWPALNKILGISKVSYIKTADIDFLRDLQSAHDRADTGRHLADMLRLVAARYKLNPHIIGQYSWPLNWQSKVQRD